MPNLFALVEAGYAVVYQDCRGTFRSAGDLTPMLNEPGDGADTIGWLLEQPWCDGTIGTFGPSYLGFVQWASVTASDRVRAIAPCVTTTDADQVTVAVNRILHGPDHPSRLILPVIRR